MLRRHSPVCRSRWTSWAPPRFPTSKSPVLSSSPQRGTAASSWVGDLLEHDGQVVLGAETTGLHEPYVAILDDATGEPLAETTVSVDELGDFEASTRAVSVAPDGGIVIGGTLWQQSQPHCCDVSGRSIRLRPSLGGHYSCRLRTSRAAACTRATRSATLVSPSIRNTGHPTAAIHCSCRVMLLPSKLGSSYPRAHWRNSED